MAGNHRCRGRQKRYAELLAKHEEYVLDGSTTDERLEDPLKTLIKKTLTQRAAATKKERHHGA